MNKYDEYNETIDRLVFIVSRKHLKSVLNLKTIPISTLI